MIVRRPLPDPLALRRAILFARSLVPPELATLLAFVAVSLGGISLVSAVARYFIPLAPVLALWIVFTAERLIPIRLAVQS